MGSTTPGHNCTAKHMKVKKNSFFLDSNVLFSGLFSVKGAPRLVLDILSLDLPVLKAVTGAYNIAEVRKNLQTKLPTALVVFQSSMKLLQIEIVPLPSKNDLVPFAGMTAEKDLPVIASSAKGRVDFLITGDKKDLLRLKQRSLPFTIVSPAEFLDEILPRLLKKQDRL